MHLESTRLTNALKSMIQALDRASAIVSSMPECPRSAWASSISIMDKRCLGGRMGGFLASNGRWDKCKRPPTRRMPTSSKNGVTMRSLLVRAKGRLRDKQSTSEAK
ncbi:hypothetical protein M513_13715 [Trichuris suis]|uniref:Uncharacterized protein n=1 Tax=Trichuris suis TaxID=68888 RepID=A0A085LKB4_9BILA|nr:hypothetical protein M513_13715 [Trichuris suis]